ncbi:glycosyl hydrolase [Fusarium oxysporum]|nr:glycosyl hydrolase [Fusarium oxysporum]
METTYNHKTYHSQLQAHRLSFVASLQDKSRSRNAFPGPLTSSVKKQWLSGTSTITFRARSEPDSLTTDNHNSPFINKVYLSSSSRPPPVIPSLAHYSPHTHCLEHHIMTLSVSLAVSWFTLVGGQTISYGLSTYTNPTLPGWNSNPNCVFVAEWDSTFFCSTSSLIAYPVLPVYASKDLITWRHIGTALVKHSQIPKMESRGIGQQDGPYTPTLRYRYGRLYLTTIYFRLGTGQHPEVKIVVYTTSNPYESKTCNASPYFTNDAT